jgi:hypothetical protein
VKKSAKYLYSAALGLILNLVFLSSMACVDGIKLTTQCSPSVSQLNTSFNDQSSITCCNAGAMTCGKGANVAVTGSIVPQEVCGLADITFVMTCNPGDIGGTCAVSFDNQDVTGPNSNCLAIDSGLSSCPQDAQNCYFVYHNNCTGSANIAPSQFTVTMSP